MQSRYREGNHQTLMKGRTILGLAVATILCTGATVSSVWANPPGALAVASDQGGEYRDKNGDPTFNVASDGTVDWYSYDGYVRYTATDIPEVTSIALARSIRRTLWYRCGGTPKDCLKALQK